MSKTPKVLKEATFNPKVKIYWLFSVSVILAITLFGIPFLILWLLIGSLLTQRYLDNMSCVLTEKSLKVKKGLWVKVEKNIPLDQITDIGLVEGPIMRMFKLKQITVETAGQSSQGPLITLIGIVGTDEFRDSVLKQRDILIENLNAADDAPSGEEGVTELLSEIRDILKRLEHKKTL
ncbi:PH domain-containing protein [Pleionea sp. CnH1-48]|uniref:PH domain-containing protein n=1 Tax=Pleionea sp. CnH1-48 TaxID=2954494 RepID=UPI002097F5ED|nr:PH domain-containing protein [Pleionea sp. CnH1-48]MCO7225183.1 PH domain-containing protein [Pleionea sp. CnH1-48]